jgi:hypothetical protein
MKVPELAAGPVDCQGNVRVMSVCAVVRIP